MGDKCWRHEAKKYIAMDRMCDQPCKEVSLEANESIKNSI